MQCIHCQRLIPDNSKFCPYCGQSADLPTPPPAPVVEPTPVPVAPVAAPVATVPLHPAATEKKTRFCHHCGTPLPKKNARCPRCGWKSISGVMSVLSLIASILLIASLVLSAFLFVSNQELRRAHLDLTDEYNRLVDDLNDLRVEHSEQQAHLDFYNNYAVVITADSKLYHCHGCENLDTKTFWIYNLSAAKQEGYTPCPACHD